MRRRIAAVAAMALCSAAMTAAEPSPAEEVRDRLRRFMDRAAEEGFTGVVLVARDGEILLEDGYGLADRTRGLPVRPDTVFPVGSITKQFTAAAVLRLRERGKLEIDDPITKFFPDVPADKRRITLHQLLSHQAGFPGAIGDDLERVGRDEYVRRALATPLRFEPGMGYEYSNVGYSLAAAIVEIASGSPYETFLHRHLFRPAGMRQTGYHLPGWEPRRLAHGITEDGGDWGTVADRALADGGPGWNLLGNGGIHSTAADMYRWHRALMGTKVLREESKRLLYGRHADEGGGSFYGYGWTVQDTPWGILVEHNGGNGIYFADFLRYLDDNVVIFYATTSRDRRMVRLGPPLADAVLAGRMPEMEPAPEPMIVPGQGPPAPEGSAAARWGLPGSFRGERAAEFLDALAEGDGEACLRFVRRAFEPGLVDRNGVDRLVEMLARIREDAGEIRVQGIRRRGEAGVAILLDAGHPAGPLQILLNLEPDEPHRITRVEVLLGD